MYKYSLARDISLSATFGALAIAFSILRFEIPYPIAPFLKIDFSEIIDLLALFIGGIKVGLIAATIHFLGLMTHAEFLVGPPMKYAAVLSMFLGFILLGYLRGGFYTWRCRDFCIGFILAIVSRLIIMSLLNIIICCYLMPMFFEFFKMQLVKLGYNPTTLDVILYLVSIICSYNIIQSTVAFIIAYPVFNIIKSRFKYGAE